MKAKSKPVSQYHPYADKVTRDFANNVIHPKLRQIAKQAERALASLLVAGNLGNLAAVSGNRFESLNNLRWEYAISINMQYRICFNWDDKEGPYNIQITKHYQPIK